MKPFGGASFFNRVPQVKSASLSVAILMLSACAPNAGERGTPADHLAAGDTSAAACREAGGILKPVGKLQSIQCVITYADGGKSCRSGADCAGDCQVEPDRQVAPGQSVAGTCQLTSDRFGCSSKVENGRAEGTICID